MRRSKPTRAIAALVALTFIAAACGDDDDDSGGDSTEAPADSEAPADTESAAEEEEAAEDAEGSEEAQDEEMAEDEEATDEDMSEDEGATGLADDSIHGNGAQAWEAAVMAGEANPLQAEGDPILLSHVNLEGSPGGSFPENREGIEIAVDYINNVLGGIGADLEAGTPGRPIEFESCPHALDPAEAQACATESISGDPAIVLKGIDFFSPVMWPVWEGFPVIDTLPIFVSDFIAPNSLATSGGCVVAFPGAAQVMVENAGHDKLAVIYSDNAPGQECWADTQERFYQYYANEGLIEFLGIPDAPGDPSDNDANVQTALNFLEGSNGAVHFGIQAADCAEYSDALDAAGNEFAVYESGSCVDDAVTSAESATGKYFGYTGPPDPSNEALLAEFDEFWQWETAQREQLLIDAEPESPLSTFMRGGFNAGILAYQILNDFVADGGDPADHPALIEFMTSVDNQHRVAQTPLDCANKVDEWSAVCEFQGLYLQWDGSGMVADPALGFDPGDVSTWYNVQPLLETVAVEVPREGG